MVFGGSCLTKIDGKTTFVEGSLPGETVEIELFEEKKDYNKAYVKRVIEASPHRVSPLCPVYDACGGCNLQFSQYEYQLQLKKDSILDSFTRNKVTSMPNIEVVFDTEIEYRNRFQFAYKGLKEKRSNKIVTLNDCLCAVKDIRSFLASEKSAYLTNCERLQVFADNSLSSTKGLENIAFGVEGESEVSIKLLNTDIHFDVRGFFQSNIEMLKKTIPLVVKDLHGENLLDMYSGVGTLSLFAKESFKNISLVEHNKKALSFAKKNFSQAENVSTFAMSGEQWVKKVKKKGFDTLIIDPPRSGIEKTVRNWICSEKIPVIRYLSCDVSTLARDTKALVDAGYTFDKLYFLDYYPQTSHIECLAYFSHSKNALRGDSC